eukprot:m.162903 g.162903  ORF g.162903 m.162903 type:complete len:580 (-) comp10306_c0_seq3:1172-2911(-)
MRGGIYVGGGLLLAALAIGLWLSSGGEAPLASPPPVKTSGGVVAADRSDRRSRLNLPVSDTGDAAVLAEMACTPLPRGHFVRCHASNRVAALGLQAQVVDKDGTITNVTPLGAGITTVSAPPAAVSASASSEHQVVHFCINPGPVSVVEASETLRIGTDELWVDFSTSPELALRSEAAATASQQLQHRLAELGAVVFIEAASDWRTSAATAAAAKSANEPSCSVERVAELLKHIANTLACSGSRRRELKLAMGGFGAEVHSFLTGMIESILAGQPWEMRANQTVYIDPEQCAAMTYDCYFLPSIPAECTADVKAAVAAGNKQAAKAWQPPILASAEPRPPFENRLIELFRGANPHGVFSIMTGMVRYLMRPNAEFQKFLDAKRAAVGLTGKKWVSLHMRRLPVKARLEGGALPSLQDVATVLQRYATVHSVTDVYLATDTKSVLNEFPPLVPNLKVHFEELPGKAKSGLQFSILSELYLLAEGEAFLGTLSSNWGRLIVALMDRDGCNERPDFYDFDHYLTPLDLPDSWFTASGFTHAELISWRGRDSCVKKRCVWARRKTNPEGCYNGTIETCLSKST